MLRSELEATGALVYLNQTEDGLGCVLSAQLSRLLKSKLAIMKNFQFYTYRFSWQHMISFCNISLKVNSQKKLTVSGMK